MNLLLFLNLIFYLGCILNTTSQLQLTNINITFFDKVKLIGLGLVMVIVICFTVLPREVEGKGYTFSLFLFAFFFPQFFRSFFFLNWSTFYPQLQHYSFVFLIFSLFDLFVVFNNTYTYISMRGSLSGFKNSKNTSSSLMGYIYEEEEVFLIVSVSEISPRIDRLFNIFVIKK